MSQILVNFYDPYFDSVLDLLHHRINVCELRGVYITNSTPNWPLKFGTASTFQRPSLPSLLFKLCLRVEFELFSVCWMSAVCISESLSLSNFFDQQFVKSLTLTTP